MTTPTGLSKPARPPDEKGTGADSEKHSPDSGDRRHPAPGMSVPAGRQIQDRTIPPLPDRLTRVMDILKKQGLVFEDLCSLAPETGRDTGEDLTRQPLTFPVSRTLRLQGMARGTRGSCSARPTPCSGGSAWTGTILGVPLLDHIIFSSRGYYSLAEHNDL